MAIILYFVHKFADMACVIKILSIKRRERCVDKLSIISIILIEPSITVDIYL